MFHRGEDRRVPRRPCSFGKRFFLLRPKQDSLNIIWCYSISTWCWHPGPKGKPPCPTISLRSRYPCWNRPNFWYPFPPSPTNIFFHNNLTQQQGVWLNSASVTEFSAAKSGVSKELDGELGYNSDAFSLSFDITFLSESSLTEMSFMGDQQKVPIAYRLSYLNS